jgi:hypothetical protein
MNRRNGERSWFRALLGPSIKWLTRIVIPGVARDLLFLGRRRIRMAPHSLITAEAPEDEERAYRRRVWASSKTQLRLPAGSIFAEVIFSLRLCGLYFPNSYSELDRRSAAPVPKAGRTAPNTRKSHCTNLDRARRAHIYCSNESKRPPPPAVTATIPEFSYPTACANNCGCTPRAPVASAPRSTVDHTSSQPRTPRANRRARARLSRVAAAFSEPKREAIRTGRKPPPAS